MVEPIRMTTKEERIQALKNAKYNPLLLDAEMIAIDLQTDSGVGPLSSNQWAGLLTGDESYAGSRSFKRLENIASRITGFPFIVPSHQGRGAEKILFAGMLENKRKSIVLSNGVFETTDRIIKEFDCKPIDITVPAEMDKDFTGGIDCEKLESIIKDGENAVACVVIVIPNNVMLGQPVSMRNMKTTADICRSHGVPLVADACRFAENAWYIKTKEDDFSSKSVREIVLEMFSYFDVVYVSAKKNGLCNSGAFVCMKDEKLFIKTRQKCITYEGHFTYGGMPGRDMEAVAIGLGECLDETYLKYRFASLQEFAGYLKQVGVPVAGTGSSAIYIDAHKVLPDVPMNRHPSWTLACALFIEGGVRGNCNITDSNKNEDYIRLAVPHRLYTMKHMKYVAKVFGRVMENVSIIKGLKVTYMPDFPQKIYEVELVPCDPNYEC